MTRFNPEDGIDGGPRCRMCHKGSSGCGGCHNDGTEGIATDTASVAADNSRDVVTFLFAAMFDMGGLSGYFGADSPSTYFPYTKFKLTTTSQGEINPINMALTKDKVTGLTNAFAPARILKNSRTVSWTTGWRSSVDVNNPTCSDDGLSWPHRTLGWKMLKDDLFGIDVTGSTGGGSTVVGPGATRSMKIMGTAINSAAHDLDSVCLDCHNPTVWNAASTMNHTDTVVPDSAGHDTQTYDNNYDETLLRGLP